MRSLSHRKSPPSRKRGWPRMFTQVLDSSRSSFLALPVVGSATNSSSQVWMRFCTWKITWSSGVQVTRTIRMSGSYPSSSTGTIFRDRTSATSKLTFGLGSPAFG